MRFKTEDQDISVQYYVELSRNTEKANMIELDWRWVFPVWITLICFIQYIHVSSELVKVHRRNPRYLYPLHIVGTHGISIRYRSSEPTGSLSVTHRRNPRDLYPLHFFHQRIEIPWVPTMVKVWNKRLCFEWQNRNNVM